MSSIRPLLGQFARPHPEVAAVAALTGINLLGASRAALAARVVVILTLTTLALRIVDSGAQAAWGSVKYAPQAAPDRGPGRLTAVRRIRRGPLLHRAHRTMPVDGHLMAGP